MNVRYKRLLVIVVVGAWLAGLAATGAMAGLSLSCTPGEATTNSIWNWTAVWTDSNGTWPSLGASGGITEGMADYTRSTDPIRQPIPAAWADTLEWMPLMPYPNGFIGFPDAGEILPREAPYEPYGYATVQPDPSPTITDEKDNSALYDHGLDYVEDYGVSTVYEYVAKDTNAGLPIPSPLNQPPPGALVGGLQPEQVIGEPNPNYVIALEREPDPSQPVAVWDDSQNQYSATVATANSINKYWPQKYNVIETTTDHGIGSAVNHLHISYTCATSVPVDSTNFYDAPADPDPVTGLIPFEIIVDPNDPTVTAIALERAPDTLAGAGVWLDAAHTIPLQAQIVPANTLDKTWTQTYNVIQITQSGGIPTSATTLYISCSYNDVQITLPSTDNTISDQNTADGSIPFAVVPKLQGTGGGDIVATIPFTDSTGKSVTATSVSMWADSEHRYPIATTLTNGNKINPAWLPYQVIDISDKNGIPPGTDRLYISYQYGAAGFNLNTAVKGTQPPDPGGDGTLLETVITAVPDPNNTQDPSATTTLKYPVVVLKIPPVALVGVWSDAKHTIPVQCEIVSANQAGADNGLTGTSSWKNWLYPVLEIRDPNGLPGGKTPKLFISYYIAGTHYVFTKNNMLTPPYTVYAIPLGKDKDPYVTLNDAIVRLDPGMLRNGNPHVNNLDNFGLMGIYLSPQLDQDPNAVNYFNAADFVANQANGTITLPTADVPYYQNQPGAGYGKAYFSTPLPDTAGAGTMLYLKVSTNAVDSVHLPKGKTNYYQYADGSVIGYCAHSGIIRMATPLPTPIVDPNTNALDMGTECNVTYRYMLPGTFTIGRSPDLGMVTNIDQLAPALPAGTTYAFDYQKVNISGKGTFTISDPTNLPPTGTYACRISYQLTSSGNGTPSSNSSLWLNGSIPMNYIKGDPIHGATYKVSISKGLNMSNPKQQPDPFRPLNTPALNNKLLYDPSGYPMYYCATDANGDGFTANGVNPNTRYFYVSGSGISPKDHSLVTQTTVDSKTAVIVHDSAGNFSSYQGGIDYGGGADLDVLWCYTDASNFPASHDVDPLSVEPVEEAIPNTPDDGSSSTQFVFRVHYYNRNGLDPLPWLPSAADSWNTWGSPSGVVLYLDAQGTGDYQPHFMEPDYEVNGLGSTIYEYRVIPHHSIRLGGSGKTRWPHQERGTIAGTPASYELYNSLLMGVYHYFFACSDDSLTFDDTNKTLLFTHQGSTANLKEWGETDTTPYYSTGLDPSDGRSVAGYSEVDRSRNRRYTSDNLNRLDYTLYVDRPTRAPGELEGAPPYKYSQLSSEHPLVSCELHMPSLDDWGNKGYDDSSYGYGRFFGTLFPFRNAMNPAMMPAYFGGGDPALLAETSCSFSSDTNLFRIMYYQYQNKPPVSIQLWLNNASEKSGTDAAHQYRAYTMQRRADQVNPDYTKGVWYEYKLQSGTADLPYGPHTYYFTANDGQHTARWPVRPDYYDYNDGKGNRDIVTDGWVPTRSYATERGTAGYFDNDYVPGPYVNRAPQISNVSVSPESGKEGRNSGFLYQCTYSDADGERPYSVQITIQTDDSGSTRQFAMVPQTPLYPTADNSAKYKAGVVYILNTATIQDFVLAKGVRKYYITATDDWGFQTNVNDIRPGETVRYPAGVGNWVQGPVISGNHAPTLSGGHVDSMDNTSNSATTWSFKVTYRDMDNDIPQQIKVFIGRLQPTDPTASTASKERVVLWDSGHTMTPSSSDTVFSHGVEFFYQTKLAGPELGATADSVQYYYAYEAYDGVDYAQYVNSSDPTLRSDSAGCFILDDVRSTDTTQYLTHFKIRPKIAKQLLLSSPTNLLDPDPQKLNDIVLIWGVFTNENLTGTNYIDISKGPVPYTGVPVQLNGTVPAGNVWVQVEGDTPLVGPLPISLPAPAGIIPDPEVFINFTQTGLPVLINDQFNGFISEDGTDRAVLTMGGVASYQSRPSGEYVMPTSPGDIASVVGVYELDSSGKLVTDSKGQYVNYYNVDTPPVDPKTDPNTSLVPPVYRTGTLIDQQTVQLDDPEEVYKVLGVYDNPSLTGVNYYLGYGYSATAASDKYKWQQAYMVPIDATLGTNVIWPEHPNDIASIKGVFMTMALDPTKNYLAGVDPAQSVNLKTPPYNPTPYVVPGDVAVDQTTGATTITINAAWNLGITDLLASDAWQAPARGVIKGIYQIADNANMTGQVYYNYDSTKNPLGDPYDPTTPISPNTGLNPTKKQVWVSYQPNFNFGQFGEFIALKTPLPVIPAATPPAITQTQVWIAYYSPGDLDANKHVALTVPFSGDLSTKMYVKIWPKAYNPPITKPWTNPDGTQGADPADGYIKLSPKLPDRVANGTAPTAGVVQIDPLKISDIFTVTGVYSTATPASTDINYYTGTLNPYQTGDSVVRLGVSLSDLTIPYYVTYVPKSRNVLIKYNDLRFTHPFSGVAETVTDVAFTQIDALQTDEALFSGHMAEGTTHFVPNMVPGNQGYQLQANTNITGNAATASYDKTTVPWTHQTTSVRDICGGLVGVWSTPDYSGFNYFNPRRSSLYMDNSYMVRLSSEVPDGTSLLYARGYQKGIYFIDRWNRDLRFDSSVAVGDPNANPVKPGITSFTRVQSSYFFGTKMTQKLVQNTPPELHQGMVTPLYGSRNTGYIYSVKYKDIDGPTGQVPYYVRVYVDGIPHDMTAVSQGTPDYKAGAIFSYAPPGGLTGDNHTFYFEASDGSAVAWYDDYYDPTDPRTPEEQHSHNTSTGTPQNVVEFPGPWVNDPPTLLNGQVAPNPTPPAGIGTSDSVSYKVTLMDADGDIPYEFNAGSPFYDLTGQNVSGSPRVWVDAGLSDDIAAPVFGYIASIEQDPLEMSKWRIIDAKVDDGTGNLVDPHWTTNQYAGKLIQISNGKDWSDISPTAYGYVYLVQSNTSNTLTIAADTLANDRLVKWAPDNIHNGPFDPQFSGGPLRYVQFRVNGLLMSKADPNQQDFTTGVDYTVTVPRLAVGNHKFHFTARTRERKPAWLLAMAGVDQSPYSIMVRFPALGDSTGPNVVSKAPTDNVAPVLSKVATSPSSTLYRGPQAMPVTVTSASRVVADDSADPNKLRRPSSMLTVLGVYPNANCDLDPTLPTALAQNGCGYFDKPNNSNPPAINAGVSDPVKLTPNLPATPNTAMLVQRSRSVDSSTLITPDRASAIGTVVGVYLLSDPLLQNPHAVDFVTNPTGLDANGKVKLVNTAPLPAGTTDVFISYRPKLATQSVMSDTNAYVTLIAPNLIGYVEGVYLASDTLFTSNLVNPATWKPGDATIALTGGAMGAGNALTVRYVPWPPAYIKYYAYEPVGSPVGSPLKHGVFVAGEPLTFEVYYQDANGDRPTYHDGVQGYVNLLFDDSGRSAQLAPLIPPTDYKVGAPFFVTLTDVPQGTHPYHFEASDGYVVTRFPLDQTGTAALDEKVQINYKPALSSPSVDHTSGPSTFTFNVIYTDQDNVAPDTTTGYVEVVITNHANPTIQKIVDMKSTGSGSYFGGMIYTTLNGVDLSASTYPEGAYDVTFKAGDGIQDADPITLAGGINKRVVPVGYHPKIVDFAVYKALAGGNLGPGSGKTTDTFVYRARYQDHDYNQPPVATFKGVQQEALTLIVDGKTTNPIPMTRVAVPGTPDWTGADDTNWPWYEARITGKTLGGGNHTYYVAGSDGTEAAVLDPGITLCDSAPPITYGGQSYGGKCGPTLMIPYFALQVIGKDGSTITDQSIVGQEVLIIGQMYFPYTQPDQKPSDSNNVIIQVTKPDTTVVSLNASLTIRPYDPATPNNWIGDITVKYSGYVDPALVTGQSLTLMASGQWTIDASWPGDSLYDGAKTDAVFDGHNDEVKITVSGPMRTVATTDPLAPDTSAPVVDMITPPMMIGSTSPGGIFGYDRALTMQIVKWVPSEGQYFRYDVGGYFPAIQPGDAVWMKPKLGTGSPGTGYPAAESITRSSVEGGWTALDNPTVEGADVGGSPRYTTSKYRLVKVLAQAYPLKTDAVGATVIDPVTLLPLLKTSTLSIGAGWNQFGNIFFNWKRAWQPGLIGVPPPPPMGMASAATTKVVKASVPINYVVPTDPTHISRVLGVYTTSTPTAGDTNYYKPGAATQPYVRGDGAIYLTTPLPDGTTSAYVKYELYPRQDVGIPMSEMKVTRLGVTKSLADAKTAGWISDYAWRFDAGLHNYVPVSPTAAGAETVLKAWSGYWIRALQDCQITIDPNTTFNGTGATPMSMSSTGVAAPAEDMEAPPPVPRD